MRKDHRRNIRITAEELNMEKEMMRHIVTNKSTVKTMCAKVTRKNLSED